MKSGPFPSKKPEGKPTRGKTASNRLRRVDSFILLYEPQLLTRGEGPFASSLFVDLGYGVDPRTTLESARRFRKLNPGLSILGVEIDPERVQAALPFADPNTSFRLGGFNLPLQGGETVRLIRAFNVLRQYEEAEFLPAYQRLAQYVLTGGLMIEGTSDPYGSLWVANLVRKKASTDVLQGWNFEALVFSTNFRLGFDPQDFQAVLPKNHIHHVVPGERVHAFFEAWKHAAAETASFKTFGPRQWFAAAAGRLAGWGYKIRPEKKWLSRGWLIWNLEASVRSPGFRLYFKAGIIRHIHYALLFDSLLISISPDYNERRKYHPARTIHRSRLVDRLRGGSDSPQAAAALYRRVGVDRPGAYPAVPF